MQARAGKPPASVITNSATQREVYMMSELPYDSGLIALIPNVLQLDFNSTTPNQMETCTLGDTTM